MAVKKIQKKYGKEGNFQWQIAAMLIGLFAGIFTFAFIGLSTLVSFMFLSQVLAFFSFAGLLIPLRFYKKWFGMNRIEAVLFNILGIGPFISALLLWVNFIFHSKVKEELIPVVSAKIISAEHFEDIKVEFSLENGFYEQYPVVRTITLDANNLKKAEAGALKIFTAEGGLGYKVFLGNEVVF